MPVLLANCRVGMHHARSLCLGLILLPLVLCTPLAAQTLSTGSLVGRILAPDGGSLEGVLVTLSRGDRNWEESVTADRTGAFMFRFLDPGTYALRAERLGFVPLEVAGIIVRSSGSAEVGLTLRPSPPPVTDVDRVTFARVRTSAVTRGDPLLAEELDRLPFQSVGASALSTLEPFSGAGLQGRGLPERLTSLTLDGMPLRTVHPPGSGAGMFHPGPWPLGLFEEIEFVRSGVDVEWGFHPGGLVRASSRRGGNAREFEVRVGVTGGPLGFDSPLPGEVDPTLGPEVTAVLSGAITPDTTTYRVVLDLRRVARPQSVLAGSSVGAAEAFLQSAGETGGVPGRGDGVATWDMASLFGRVDWSPRETLGVSVRSGMNLLRDGAWDGGNPRPEADRATLESHEGFLHGSLTSRMGEAGALEVRVGLDTSQREYRASRLPGNGSPAPPRTLVHRGGVMAGGDSDVEGEFGRTGFSLGTVLHYLGGRHHLKGGVELGREGHRADRRSAQAPVFLFPTQEDFVDRRGLLSAALGSPIDASYASARMAVFLQDRWMPSPSFSVTAGARIEYQNLPLEDLHSDERWFEASGIDGAEVADPSIQVSPRVSWEWSPGGGGRLTLSGAAGLQRGQYDPALLLEVLGDTGTVTGFRRVGSQAAWPGVAAPDPPGVAGRRLTLMGPRFDQPLSRFLEASLSMALGRFTVAEVTAEQRHTDFLPRRRDLNRVPRRFARDQFGREIFGQVVHQDGLLAILPGSDRRFQEFDIVSALESDGWSTWSGVTMGVRHATGDDRSLRVSYTWSTVEDNAPLSEAGWPRMVRERPGADGEDPTWLAGTSDLHRPHHVRASGSLRLPGIPGITLGGVYSGKSGRPFTPTVRDLLGADPTALVGLHPITIPEALVGLTAPLEGAWPCLRDLRGGGLQRNTCRAGSVHVLDTRVTVSLPAPAGQNWHLSLDVYNLLDAGDEIPDGALFLVDGAGSVSEDPGSDRITLPVVLNPDFGQPLFRSSPGRHLRVGLTMRF
jgi:hypothetical protein